MIMAASEKRLRKRKKCGKCGETFSHSGYYLHSYDCKAKQKEEEFESDSESDTFTIASTIGSGGSSEFHLSDDNENIILSVSEEHPGKYSYR